MTKQDFIKKWIGWVSYTDREKLSTEMETDLEEVSKQRIINAFNSGYRKTRRLPLMCNDISELPDAEDYWQSIYGTTAPTETTSAENGN